ncbi:MAG: diguanylate cyclase [Planctomycetales bacterium]|nr:diguanylate cyclase [Planctomycetales bacterium]
MQLEADYPSDLSVVEASVASLEDQMAQRRLGVLLGLFYALRAKHPPSAAHGFRVAIGCSKWAGWRGMLDDSRDLLEVAALLHDVGKIGIPDSILQKPTLLTSHEQLVVEMSYGVLAEMLRAAGASEELLEIIHQSQSPLPDNPEDHHLASRMLAIVDAFDSMTCVQVFRSTMSRERAIDELFKNTNKQFDCQLVSEFAQLISEPRLELDAAVANRWLVELIPNESPCCGVSAANSTSGSMQLLIDSLYHRRLLDAHNTATVYLDPSGQILVWNRAAEQLTGRTGASVVHHTWSKELMGLVGSDGSGLSDDECPFRMMCERNAKVEIALQLKHVDGNVCAVTCTALPIFVAQSELGGAILLVQDDSTQAKLEQRVHTLHEFATRDPLTKVANRARLELELPSFVEEHSSIGQPGSLIICDIDHFKKINDSFGHQAGDEALVTFAGVLSEVARSSDLVARFGGEEFVVLCAGADNPTATARAEDFRRAVARTPVPSLKGRTMTASFGVTEIQHGDTHETLLARADRALLQAKESGRNRVVQLGSGRDCVPMPENSALLRTQQNANWMSWFVKSKQQPLVVASLLASVPQELALQKLSGFVNDHGAEILSSTDKDIVLKIDGSAATDNRQQDERVAVLVMKILITPVQFRPLRGGNYQSQTKLDVEISPVRPRDRRIETLVAQANRLLVSFNSYLVAQYITPELSESIIEPR